MDHQCLTKTCTLLKHNYPNSGSAYMNSALMNADYSANPYNLYSMSNSELSCSLISSTTLDLINPIGVSNEWINNSMNNSYLMEENISEHGEMKNTHHNMCNNKNGPWNSDSCNHKSNQTTICAINSIKSTKKR